MANGPLPKRATLDQVREALNDLIVHAVQIGGHLRGDPKRPKILPMAVETLVETTTGGIAQSRVFERPHTPPLPFNDSRTILAGRAFAPRRK